MLYHFKKYFDQKELSIIIKYLSNCDTWHFKGNGYQEHLYEKEQEIAKSIFNKIFFENKNFSLIKKELLRAFDGKNFTRINQLDPGFMRYPEGKKLNLHTDGQSSGGTPLNFIVIVFYLNDDYEGGNLYYVDESTGQELDIQTQAGDLVAISPEVLHGTRRSKGGMKYVALSFIDTSA